MLRGMSIQGERSTQADSSTPTMKAVSVARATDSRTQGRLMHYVPGDMERTSSGADRCKCLWQEEDELISNDRRAGAGACG